MINKIIEELKQVGRPFVITDDDLTHNRAVYESIEIVKKYENDGKING